MWTGDPVEFRELAAEYRYAANPSMRAPDRLSVWLKPRDLDSNASISNDPAPTLVSAPDNAALFGYRVADTNSQALASTVGTLAYIAFETHRLFDQVRFADENFVPLDLTRMAEPGVIQAASTTGLHALDHNSGQVFDLSMARLPGNERECLQFVLDDLGWYGYLGFTEEPRGSQTMHIGCAPTARAFFSQVFDDQQAILHFRIPLASDVTSQRCPASSAQGQPATRSCPAL
jgi:hypothetical protein